MCGRVQRHTYTKTMHTHTHTPMHDTPRAAQGRDLARLWDQQLRGKRHLLPVSLLFTQSSWRFSSWFPLSEPPAGCLNRPLINPSVRSLLHPQPSEEGSNPAKQTGSELDRRGGMEMAKTCFFLFF